jgi:hypothetical protein
MTTLREEIIEKCSAQLIASRDEAEIAHVVSAGRTRLTGIEIGNGTVLETLGITAGNLFLDFVGSNPAFKYVKPLLDQGRLRIGSNLVQQTIKSLVNAGVLTQMQSDALCALGVEASPVSPSDVAHALEGL